MKNLLLAVVLALPAGVFAASDHEPAVAGLRIGMTAGEVLEVMQRPGDQDEEKGGELIIYWRLESGDVLQVNFWKDHVSHLGLQYREPRQATELGLVAQVDQRSSLDSRDPRAEYGYRESQTRDQDRLVWSRSHPTGQGYDVEVQFLSGSRKQFGEQRGQFVQFKYVTLSKADRKKFRKTIGKD